MYMVHITIKHTPFLHPGHSWRLLLVGGFLLLRWKDGGHKEDVKVTGVNQHYAPIGYEKWNVCSWVQAYSENIQTRQSKTGHPCQQLPSLEEI